MPHSGGGGSHGGGGHGGGGHGGSHHSSGGSHSGGRVSSTPFAGCHTYAVYNKHGQSRLVYASSKDYHAEVTKKETISNAIFGCFFLLPGLGELIAILCIAFTFIHLGVHKTPIPKYADDEIRIWDEYDLVSKSEERSLENALEDFRDNTGIIPAVEFVVDDDWDDDYVDMEAFAYNEYVCNFDDENHLLIVYSYGYENERTGFNEFHWESMWGDDLGRTASTSDEDFLAEQLQNNFDRANGDDVAGAIEKSFATFYKRLSTPGVRIDTGKAFMCFFFLIHGSAFFGAGFSVVYSSIKKYKKSKETGERTYKIKGTPTTRNCSFCGAAYYIGTVGDCPHCGAPLV